jgi:hypothetical protein
LEELALFALPRSDDADGEEGILLSDNSDIAGDGSDLDTGDLQSSEITPSKLDQMARAADAYDHPQGHGDSPNYFDQEPLDSAISTDIIEHSDMEETEMDHGKWTEIPKDYVNAEALEQCGYEYEETQRFYYVFTYLGPVRVTLSTA